MTDQKKAYLLAAVAVLFWSTAASAFKLSLRYLNTVELLVYSSFTAAAVLFLILLKQKKLPLLADYLLRDYLKALLLGLLNPFLYYLILFKAYMLLPGQMAQPLNFVWPLMIVLLSIPLLKQKIKIGSIIAIIISFTGVIIISTRGKPAALDLESPTGVFLALSSSLIWALFFILNVRDKRDEVCQLFCSFFFGFILSLAVFLFRITMPDWRGIVGAVYIGIFEMGITFVIWVKALKLSRTTAQVNNLIYLTPFLALVFLNVSIHEKILPSTLVGVVLIVAGIVLQSKLPNNKLKVLFRKEWVKSKNELKKNSNEAFLSQKRKGEKKCDENYLNRLFI